MRNWVNHTYGCWVRAALSLGWALSSMSSWERYWAFPEATKPSKGSLAWLYAMLSAMWQKTSQLPLFWAWVAMLMSILVERDFAPAGLHPWKPLARHDWPTFFKCAVLLPASLCCLKHLLKPGHWTLSVTGWSVALCLGSASNILKQEECGQTFCVGNPWWTVCRALPGRTVPVAWGGGASQWLLVELICFPLPT